MKNLGPNILPIAFWLTVITFVARCIVSLATRRNTSQRGFEVIATGNPGAAKEPAAADFDERSVESWTGPRREDNLSFVSRSLARHVARHRTSSVMSPEDSHPVRNRLRKSMRVESFGQPATPADIAAAEAQVGASFPNWLRELYLACDGFTGPTGIQYLFPLATRDGLVDYTNFLRLQDWAPAWLPRAIVFGENVGTGTSKTFFASLEGELIDWCLGDGEEYSKLPGDAFDLFRREQASWDEV